jgi:hypothetical protein
LFVQTLATTPHLSLDGFSGLVYEYLLRCFILEDPSLRVSKLFHVGVVVVRGDIPRLVALVLGANKLLAMANDTSGLHPIIVGEEFFQLISRSIVL